MYYIFKSKWSQIAAYHDTRGDMSYYDICDDEHIIEFQSPSGITLSRT